MGRWISRLLPGAAALAWAAAACAEGGVGISSLTLQGEYAVPALVWYPSTAATQAWQAGPYRVEATRDAPVAPGKHPLVLLSHGSGGSELGHADLAEALARRGYVVAAPRHQGDSYDRPEGRGSDVQLYARPWQAVATLDAVLADPRLSAAIDPKRIGMAGFSAGGYTTLVMAGARPDARLVDVHCRAHPDDPEVCPQGAATQRRITRPGWTAPLDGRVRAAVAMAPFAIPFDASGLAAVTIPLRIVRARDDRIIRAEWNIEPLLRALPAGTESSVVPGGHYVFVAPCTPQVAALAPPELCSDAPGVDRRAVHTQLNDEIAAFFDRTMP